jgi:hypothetical protein
MMLGEDGFEKLKDMSTFGKVTSTELREGYFLLFAEKMKKSITKMPIMVTGGFRSRAAMENALLSNSCDAIGVGRPLTSEPDAISRLLRFEISDIPRIEDTVQLPWYLQWTRYIIVGNLLRLGFFQFWTYRNLIRIGHGQTPTTEKDSDLLVDFIWMDRSEKKAARELKGLDNIVGSELNAPSTIRMKLLVLIVLIWFLRKFIF